MLLTFCLKFEESSSDIDHSSRSGKVYLFVVLGTLPFLSRFFLLDNYDLYSCNVTYFYRSNPWDDFVVVVEKVIYNHLDTSLLRN